MTGAKPPKKKVGKNIPTRPLPPLPPPPYDYNSNINTNSTNNLTHFSDSVTTVLGFCKKNNNGNIPKLTNPADSQKVIIPEKVFSFAQVMPTFPGGKDSLNVFLARNIIYPREALEKGIKGTVLIAFTVTKEGEICDPQIVKPVDRLLGYEALRVLSLMPKWNPGSNNGEKVNVSYFLPINISFNQ